MKKKKIAVLLTCFNRKQKTIECLNLLFNQNLIGEIFDLNVYLVDDGSTDGTGDAVKELFSSVNLIAGTGDLFWNRGMHLAWQTAVNSGDYDFFLWLNDDTMLFPDAIDELLTCYDLAGDRSIICGTTCSKINGEITYGGRSISGEKIKPNGSLQQCEIMNGNCVLISNKTCTEVGIIDPLFIHSIGDFDYGFRAKKKGFEIFITRSFIAFCDGNDRLPTWCLPHVLFKDRIKNLYSPLGNSHPYYFFIYERRHFGIMLAIKHFCSIHLRVLIPTLWKH